MKKTNQKNLEGIREAIESLEISDFSDTAGLDVQMDELGSVLLNSFLFNEKARKGLDRKNVSLYDVLEQLVRREIADDELLDSCDEITSLIQHKDYEGYSDEELSKELGALVNTLQEHLKSFVDQLEKRPE